MDTCKFEDQKCSIPVENGQSYCYVHDCIVNNKPIEDREKFSIFFNHHPDFFQKEKSVYK